MPERWDIHWAQYGAPGATDETDETGVIAVGNQFAKFGDDPVLPSDLSLTLKLLTERVCRDAKIAQFVSDAITVAQEAHPSPLVQ